MDRYDYNKLYEHGHFDGLDVVVKVSKEQQDKEVSEEKIMQESLEFISGQANSFYQEILNNTTDVIYKGVRELNYYKKYFILHGIAKFAIEKVVSSLEDSEESDKSFNDILNLFKLQSSILYMGIAKLKEVIKEEYLEKFNLN